MTLGVIAELFKHHQKGLAWMIPYWKYSLNNILLELSIHCENYMTN